MCVCAYVFMYVCMYTGLCVYVPMWFPSVSELYSKGVSPYLSLLDKAFIFRQGEHLELPADDSYSTRDREMQGLHDAYDHI